MEKLNEEKILQIINSCNQFSIDGFSNYASLWSTEHSVCFELKCKVGFFTGKIHYSYYFPKIQINFGLFEKEESNKISFKYAKIIKKKINSLHRQMMIESNDEKLKNKKNISKFINNFEA